MTTAGDLAIALKVHETNCDDNRCTYVVEELEQWGLAQHEAGRQEACGRSRNPLLRALDDRIAVLEARDGE